MYTESKPDESEAWPKSKPDESKQSKANKCMHCGEKCKPREGKVCDKCYSKYTPEMLADLEN